MTLKHFVQNDSATPTDRDAILFSSICRNCAHQGSCAGLSRATKPVVFCEEHECGPRRGPVAVEAAARPAVQGQAGAVHMLGLCANCDSRQECKLPKATGGVWYCEEYR